MSLRLNFARWTRVVLLGCALGLLFVAVNFSIWSHYHRLPFSTAFKLSDEPLKQELVRVIGAQLAAFRQGDFAGAYALADSSLKAQFAPASFEQMIKNSYPAIARSRTVTYGVMIDNGGFAVVVVGVTGRSGNLLHYEYLLRREKTGWKVSGVVRIKLQETTV